jgi:hypothetical protein
VNLAFQPVEHALHLGAQAIHPLRHRARLRQHGATGLGEARPFRSLAIKKSECISISSNTIRNIIPLNGKEQAAYIASRQPKTAASPPMRRTA